MFKKCMALASAAGMMLAACALPVSAQTYTSTAAPASIPDINTSVFTTMTVSVPDTFVINSLSVTVGFTHTFNGDIANMALVAPTGEIITLALPTGSGGLADNFKNTTFDNRAASEIPTATTDAPFRKRYRASSTLGTGQISLAAAQTAGLQANGTWTLRCNDDASGDVGTIDYVILSLNERVFVGSEVSSTPNLSNNVAVPPGTNPAIPGAPTQSQTGLTVAIPDGDAVTGATSTLVVAGAEAQFISGLDVSFSVTHPSLSDLRVRLTHPNGTTSVDVVIPGAMAGSAASPDTDSASPTGVNRPYVTTLSDGAPALSGGAAPYRGKFAPSNSLTAFNTLTSNGTWTLTVLDEVGGNTGSIREWSLHIRGASASPSGIGSATPPSVVQGNSTTLSVVVTPALAINNVTSVTVDASTLTGNAGDTAVALTRVGVTDTWAAGFTAAGTIGSKTLPFTITETGAVANGIGNIAVTITPAPPVNATCLTATMISTLPFTSGAIAIGGSPTDPSINPSCDLAANTGASNPVWFSLTPAAQGVYQFFESTSTDTVLSIWTGTCAGTLTQVLCDDSSIDSSPGRLVLLNGSTTYFIAISRFGAPNANADTVNLSVSLIPPPANDDCSTAVVVTAPTALTSASIDARGALPDVGLTCNSTGFTSSTTAGVWFRADVPALSADDYILTYTETASNDVIWGVFTGSCGSLTQVFCNTTDSGNTFLVRAGQTYYFLLGMQGSASQPSSATSYTRAFTWAAATSACCNTTLNTCTVITKSACATQSPAGVWRGPTNVTCSVATSLAVACDAAPANDLCPSAMAIVGSLPQSLQVNSPAAATDDLDSSCNSTSQGGGTPPFVTRFGVWYQYTTGADAGTLSISELISANDVVIQMFTGSCGALTPVQCIDGVDSVAGGSFSLNANTTYRILLGMWGNNTTPSGAAPQYNMVVNSFTPVTGACCNGTSCSIELQSTCTGYFAGPLTTCITGPTYSYPGPAIAIPDNSLTGVSNTITVSNAVGTISNLKVQLNLNHLFAGDVKVTLTGPNATVVDLVARPGATGSCNPLALTTGVFGSANDLVGVYILDDSAAQNINVASAANTVLASGNYKPSTCGGVDSSLGAAFNGISANGNWTLTVYDAGQAVVGSLNSWGLIVNDVAPTICDGVGACCNGVSCSQVLNAAACPGDPSNFHAGATCTPDPCGAPTTENCCRGTTCNSITAGTCTGVVAGSNSLVVTTCGAGNALSTCCFADYNHDGIQSIDDLFLYFNAYFTASPWANVGGDGVATPTIDDLFLYINAYFSTCAP